MRVLATKLRVEIENETRVFLESLDFEIEMRVSQKSGIKDVQTPLEPRHQKATDETLFFFINICVCLGNNEFLCHFQISDKTFRHSLKSNHTDHQK